MRCLGNVVCGRAHRLVDKRNAGQRQAADARTASEGIVFLAMTPGHYGLPRFTGQLDVGQTFVAMYIARSRSGRMQ
jgi:hypothetical protein